MITERIPIVSRPQWLAARKQDVTASDAAAIFSAHPHKSPLALWAEKSGTDLPSDENAFARRGRHLEPAILSAAGEAETFSGGVLEPARFYVRAPALRIGATPDALFVRPDAPPEPVDAKSVASWVFDTAWADGAPPLHIQIQVLVQAMLLDAPRGWVACAVMTPEWPIHVYEIPRNPDAEKRILLGVKEFWQSVEKGEMPAPLAKDHATLAAIFPRAEQAEPVDWSAENDAVALLDEWAALGEELAPKKARISQIEALVKARMGSAERAHAPGWAVSWKEQKRKAYAVAESVYRVLRIKAYSPDGEEVGA